MRVIGMISGTSYDAIEAVALEMSLEGGVAVAELLGHVSAPYPSEVRDAVAAVLPPAPTTIEQVCRLDTLIGQSFAEVAAALADQCCDGAADVVCSHGQTVFHWVEGGHALGTLQLGQGAWIAERTGATVVTDVRIRDIAAGGHGAPLASLLDVLVLGAHPSTVRGALNLGGIANVTVVGPVADPLAFDIGPANALIDAAVRWLSEGAEDHDHDGRHAERGSVDAALLSVLLDDPYYSSPPPKSTGKEHFHLGYLLERLGSREIAPDDLVATVTALTAETVAGAVAELGVQELVVSGGGTRNPVLMSEIERRLPGVSLVAVDAFGIPEAAKEAVVFALIGFLTVHGLPSTVPSCTGATHTSVLGAIIPGRQEISSLPGTDSPHSFEIVARESEPLR
ncbi:MAG: anmK [Acidimicrobiaceae bacterium]|nr:anmK [Acidimicrobiaceae bacterium]